ncbi:MAG: hypothetical protein RSD49_20625 [Hafnia sp.]
MRKMNIERYPEASGLKELDCRSAHGLLMCLDVGLSNSTTAISMLERIYANEADGPTRAVWGAALTDLKRSVPLPEVLVRTGFFGADFDRIFLLCPDHESMFMTVKRYLDTLYS